VPVGEPLAILHVMLGGTSRFAAAFHAGIWTAVFARLTSEYGSAIQVGSGHKRRFGDTDQGRCVYQDRVPMLAS
jgi:hypothetical protein